MEAVERAFEEHVQWHPATEQDRADVRLQLERLLETAHFRNSRRYPSLFRFIVEETLEGRGEFLKERLLGVQVFGRPPNYDTATDPVVRVTVAEIRKRIAQYYHDESRAHELRIELLPGRYEAEFRRNRESPRRTPVDTVDATPRPSENPTGEEPANPVLPPNTVVARPWLRWARTKHYRWGFAAAAVLLAAGGLAGWSFRPTAMERFWAPVTATHQPVLICLPIAGGKYGAAATAKIALPSQIEGPSSAATPGTYSALQSLGENVVFSDVRGAMSISGFLAQHHTELRLRLNTAVSMDDLRQGPAVLIGALDNPWTLRALSRLRYQFGGNDDEIYWIVDTRTGKPSPWALDLKTPITSVTRDFAIIARIHAEDTGQPEVIIAGIGMSGTAAAGELLSDPAQMEVLRQRVGKAFDKGDFEAVISTDVANGIAGTPKIVSVEAQ